MSPTIDSAAFAREGRRQSGRVRVAALGRLADVVVGGDESLDFVLVGSNDRRGLWLDLHVEGVLGLRCQRCLEPMQWQCDLSSRLRLILPGQPWPDEALEDDESDPIEADPALDLYGLIEEEILLAMPLAPRHEGCDAPRDVDSSGERSPFAVLAGLKPGSGKV